MLKYTNKGRNDHSKRWCSRPANPEQEGQSNTDANTHSDDPHSGQAVSGEWHYQEDQLVLDKGSALVYQAGPHRPERPTLYYCPLYLSSCRQTDPTHECQAAAPFANGTTRHRDHAQSVKAPKKVCLFCGSNILLRFEYCFFKNNNVFYSTYIF